MAKHLLICLGVLLAVACDGDKKKPAALPPSDEGIGVFFKPDGCRKEVIRWIGRAQKSIQVQAYSLTSDEIAEALVAAHRRGVKVEVIVDSEKGSRKRSRDDYLHKKKIPTFEDAKHDKAHSKIIIIDGQTVITGSFNFADETEDTADNLLVIRDHPKLIAQYIKNFEDHRAHSEPYR